jgi:HSP20 family molecular chaperone IbpA
MWAEACAMLAEAERLHRQFFEVASGRGAPVWEAPVDVLEEGADLAIWVALPGVAPESIEVSIEGAVLSVSGVRKLRVSARAIIRRLEIPHGRLERRVALPANGYFLEDIDVRNGCVQLRLRRG